MPQARSVQFSVGVLVLIGAALVVGFVLFLTRDRITTSDAMFETYLRESVQGLEVGSAVRFRGVAVGRVTEIGLTAAEYRHVAQEDFEDAFQLVLVRYALNLTRIGSIPRAADAVAAGLRARLASQGITGVVYIELDFLGPEIGLDSPFIPWIPIHPWIPSVPSTVARAQTALEQVIAQLETVDIGVLANNLNGLLVELRALAGGTGAGSTMAEINALIEAAREVLVQADVPALTAELRGAGAATRGLLEGDDLRDAIRALTATAQALQSATAALPPTISQIQAALRAARATTTDLQAELAPILRDLRATTANLRDTTEALRRSPSQTLFGAPPPPPGAGQ